MGLLKSLAIIALFYYGFKFLFRLFAPYLMSKAASNMQKNARSRYNNKSSETQVKEGETIIDKAPRNSNQSKNTVGEYVDFEEID